MLNVFTAFGLIWTVIIILYALAWSDLCTTLSGDLFLFLTTIIISSLIVGRLLKNKFRFFPMQENRHKNSKITILFLIFFTIEIIIERNLPILNVIKGQSYNSVNFIGIRGLHSIVSALAIVYSFYLSYVYISFKNKKVLIELMIIVGYFALLMQRQNILISILGFVNLAYVANIDIIKQKNRVNHMGKRITRISIAIFSILLLYGFGIMGNIRYGSSWEWNDSSMISKLGKKSEKFPSIIPEPFFWDYIYLVSPLVNLNENIKNYDSKFNFSKYSIEFVPEIIANKLDNYQRDKIYLPVKSLTASTSYVRSYRYFGYIGMTIMFIVQMAVSIFVITVSYKKNRESFIVNTMCVIYFLIFSFFENTFVYTTTAIVLIFAIFNSNKYVIKN